MTPYQDPPLPGEPSPNDLTPDDLAAFEIPGDGMVSMPPVQQKAPSGVGFDWGVLNVQTQEEYDAKPPEIQHLIHEIKELGVLPSQEWAANRLIDIQKEISARNSPAAQQGALMARHGIKTVPPGYALEEDEQGAPRFSVIPGGPVAKQRITYNQSVKTASGTVLEDVTKAMDLLQKSGRFAAGYGAALSSLPESDARQLQAFISSIQGNVGVDQLIKIKQTGAGLGQVPQSQLDLLSRLLGNLDQAQKPAELMDVLKRIDRIYSGIVAQADAEILDLLPPDQRNPDQAAPPAAQPAQPAERIIRGQRWLLNPQTGKYYVAPGQ
jgi:hypothetical protein